MKEKVRIFLETDLLEKYLLGTTSAEETAQVERYIATYPEVRNTDKEVEDAYSILSGTSAQDAGALCAMPLQRA